MRVQPVFILLLLTALAGRFGFNRAVAAPFLSATNIDWQEFYGRTTNLPPAHQPAEPLTLCLLLHGTENADRTNIQITVSNWLTLHPQAVVVPVCRSGRVRSPLLRRCCVSCCGAAALRRCGATWRWRWR